MCVSEALPKRYRLLEARAFARVLGAGQGTRDRYFSVAAVVSGRAHLRVGVVVSRRVSRKAVARNRIKRQVRESVRRAQRRLAGLDLVVVGQPAAAGAPGAVLRASLERHWISIITRCKAC